MVYINSSIVSYDPVVQGEYCLVPGFEPAHFIFAQVVDVTLQDGLSANIDGDVLDGARKRRKWGRQHAGAGAVLSIAEVRAAVEPFCKRIRPIDAYAVTLQ